MRKRTRRVVEEKSREDEIQVDDSSSVSSVFSDQERDEQENREKKRTKRRINSTIENESLLEENFSDHYAPGAILRVKMQDFVTYSTAEFHLGPNLNMIIGPNGTGKSTLVCAIALGLGGKPEILGRAKSIGEFVKEGKPFGLVEIMLKGQLGEADPIIQRTIHRDNISEWLLNGKRESAKAVKEVIDRYNVQIDNLCQFLPQDRVVEFAHMTPQMLLMETERVTGSIDMVPNHEKLIELHSEYKNLVSQTQLDIKELEQQKERQDAAAIEVDRFRRRKQIQEELDLLEKYRPFAEYQDTSSQYNESRQRTQVLKENYNNAKHSAAPSLRILERSKQDLETSSNKVDYCKIALDKAQEIVSKELKEQDVFNGKLEVFKADIDAVEKRKEQQKHKLRKLQNDLSVLNERATNEPDTSESSMVNEKLAELQTRNRKAENARSMASKEVTDIEDKIAETMGEIDKYETELRSLESTSNRKLYAIRSYHSHTYDAIMWLRENKSLFKGEVFEPPILTISITDLDMVDAVETAIQRSQLLSFTCLSREDYLTFTSEVIDKRNLNVYVSEFSGTENPTFDTFKRLCSTEKLQSLGLSGWLVDCISGPDPVLTMLCHMCQIHTTAYAKRALSVAQQDAIERFTNSEGQLILRRYVTRSMGFRLQRSLYGSRAVVSESRRIGAARVLSDSGIDQSRKKELTAKLSLWKDRIESLNSEKSKYLRRRQNAISELKDIRAERDILKKKQSEIHKLIHDHKRVLSDIDEIKREIDCLRDAPDTSAEEIDDINGKIKELLEERELYCNLLLDSFQSLVDCRKAYVASSISHFKHKNDYEELQRRSNAINENLRTLESEYSEAKSKTLSLKSQVREIRNQISKLLEAMSEEEQDEINKMSQLLNITNMKDLEEKIAEKNTELDSIFSGNQHVLEQFERRAAQISSLQTKVDSNTARIEQLSIDIGSIRSKWEKDLDELVAKISYEFSKAFESIGCGGTVNIGKHEDFEKWCIEIKVRFREGDQLQLLTHQRQSGGERSVSTIFYLMSLQCITKAPFRVVDEINQGMDPRNERMVHSRMVEVACQENASQYLLITPKLLPDLTYHKKMVSHCIFSGDFMPDTEAESSKCNIGRLHKYIKTGLRLRGILV
ncbi:hypothetical protein V1511DRAFT_491802 [Dipodascopsis uninucleata]